MPANLKSLQAALDKLTEYIAPMEGTRKTLEQCAETMKEHERVSTALETKLADLVKDMKKTKADTLDPREEKALDTAIEKWGRTQMYLEMRSSSGYCETLMKYLVTALKEVPKATAAK